MVGYDILLILFHSYIQSLARNIILINLLTVLVAEVEVGHRIVFSLSELDMLLKLGTIELSFPKKHPRLRKIHHNSSKKAPRLQSALNNKNYKNALRQR